MRKKFIEVLDKMAEKDKDLIVLVGDLGFGVFDDFRKKFPKQFMNMGIAEQNMIGVAAGLAITGKKVVIYSIAPFVTFRCLEQIRNDLCYQNLNVAIVGAGAGYTYSTSGSSHHIIEDIGVMRSIPNMRILSPSNEQDVEGCTENLFKMNGPVYMRLGKLLGKTVKGRNFVFRKGTWFENDDKVDVVLITTGEILSVVLEAKKTLSRKNIHCNVLNLHMLKPVHVSAIAEAAHKSDLIIVVEEHNVVGGLGTIISDILSRNGLLRKIVNIGITDMFVHEVGSIEYIRESLKITEKDIVERVLKCLD